jgi:hypothetical protein
VHGLKAGVNDMDLGYVNVPKDKDYLLFVSEGEERRGYYPLWMR